MPVVEIILVESLGLGNPGVGESESFLAFFTGIPAILEWEGL